MRNLNSEKSNILQIADKIIHHKVEDEHRDYGPFGESMERAAQILGAMVGEYVPTDYMFKALIALKLSRESYGHKEDNLIDAVGYIAGLNEYYQEQTEKAPSLKHPTEIKLENDIVENERKNNEQD